MYKSVGSGCRINQAAKTGIFSCQLPHFPNLLFAETAPRRN